MLSIKIILESKKLEDNLKENERQKSLFNKNLQEFNLLINQVRKNSLLVIIKK